MGGMRAIYGDTDSGFLHGVEDARFQAFVEHLNKDVFPKRMAALGCLPTHHAIKLAYEKKFARVVFLSKKRYVGRFAHYKGSPAKKTSKPEIKGIEYKRGDTARFARRIQERIIKLLVGEWECHECKGKSFRKDEDCKGTHAPPIDSVEAYEAVLKEFRQVILSDALAVEDAQLSKKLTKSPREYVVKDTAKGKGQDLAHVAVAKLLIARGLDVGVRSRINYVVVDASVSPMKVIPADDYKGECDRFYLWENLVFPAAQRLLAAAFPKVDWDQWEKVRPPKPRRRKSAVPEEQGALDFVLKSSERSEDFREPAEAKRDLSPRRRKTKSGYVTHLESLPDGRPVVVIHPRNVIAQSSLPEVPTSSRRRVANAPYPIRLSTRLVTTEKLHALKDLLQRYPGPRPAHLHTTDERGATVELDLKLSVRGDPELRATIDVLFS